MHGKSILKLTDVSKQGDGCVILSGIDWQIRKGQHWALLGANGAGKTTLLRLVAGYDWPTTGSVAVLGSHLGRVDVRELRKSIGWVTSSLLHQFKEEDCALEIVLSGLDASIGLWREFKKPEIRRAREALSAVGGRGFLRQPYRTLSQGERQRVMIARGLLSRPSLLVLDEPCAGLDPAARESVLSDLTRFVRRSGAPTLVFVTHHIEEIPSFVTHGLMLKKGKILAKGPIDRVCTSDVLSRALGCRCAVTRLKDRFQLDVRGN